MEVATAIDIERQARDALPKRAKFLAAPIAAGAKELVHTSTLRLLESDAFDTVWRVANERAHDQIVVALTGREGEALTTTDGTVVLNLRPLATAVVKRLATLGVGVPENLDVSRIDARFVLIASDDLKSIQSYARLLDRLAWVLPFLTLLLYGLAVAVAPRRRTGLMRAGIGITIAMAASIVAYGFARTTYLDNLPSSANPDAAAAIFDTVTRFVERGLRSLLAIGLLVWLGTWLAGPARLAGAVRRQWHRALGRAGDELGDAIVIGPVNAWVAKNASGLRIGLVAIVCVLLLTWDRPTGSVVVLLGAFVLVGMAVIQLVGAGGAATESSATGASAPQHT